MERWQLGGRIFIRQHDLRPRPLFLVVEVQVYS
jgi:hypothetical protein